jgi:hypothetical protein
VYVVVHCAISWYVLCLLCGGASYSCASYVPSADVSLMLKRCLMNMDKAAPISTGQFGSIMGLFVFVVGARCEWHN